MFRSRYLSRATLFAGFGCLAASLLLMPMGVRIVRADDAIVVEASTEPETNPTEPLREAGPASARIIKAGDGIEALQPGVAGVEISPGVVVLNTSGYNYRSAPTEFDPAAMELESKTP